MADERTCRNCQHCGMDMDMDPYCAHPAVLKDHKYGLSLSGMSAPTKIDGQCTPYRILWEIRITNQEKETAQ